MLAKPPQFQNKFSKKRKSGDLEVKSNEQNGKVHKKFHHKERKQITPVVKHREDQKWYEYQVDEKATNPGDSLSGEMYQALFDEATGLLATDNDLYTRMSKSQGGSEASWLLNVVRKGTAADRMTAMQLQMHNSPVHSLPYADAMISQLSKKIQREAMDLIPILEETFVNHFLPPNRKLVTFGQRPLAKLSKLSNNESSRSRILILWMFEHQLKEVYSKFVKALEILSSGQVLDLAKKALRTTMTLLAEKPEAEQLLLSMLTNKLGHPNRHIGAHVARLLEELANKQPNMKGVIVKEVERVIYRKNVHPRAHLYAATFLSQIELKTSETTLATDLIKIYFGLFKTIVSQKKGAGDTPESNNRLLSILLAASNRALPFAKENASLLDEDINALYRVVNTTSFSVAIQTLKLLHKMQSLSESLADRFYSALFRKIGDPIPTSCYNQLMLLLFKSLKTDQMENRVRTFVKRLLQVATTAPPPLAAGILILVSRLADERRTLLITVRDANKLSKASAFSLDNDDGEEHYVDIGLDGKPVSKFEAKKDEPVIMASDEEDSVGDDEKKPLKGSLGSTAKDGWLHKSAKTARTIYDKTARNPLFIDCTTTVDAELLLLAKHYHPSVAVFAQQMVEGKPVSYRGDPLEDFTMMKFLDRFAYRNPKENKVVSSSNIFRKKAYDPWGVRALAVTSKEYLAKKTAELPPDERYLHRFAQLKFQPKENKKEKEDDWEISSVNSDEFDAILERFEPGEANEVFDDVDFSTEFSAEKQKKKSGKRKEESDGEDDELSDYGDMEDDEEEEDDALGGGGDEDDDEEEEDDDDVMEDDEMENDEEERAFTGKSSKRRDPGFDDSEEDDFGGDDVEMAGDQFGAMLEDMDEEDKMRSKTSRKHKIRRPKGFKKRK